MINVNEARKVLGQLSLRITDEVIKSDTKTASLFKDIFICLRTSKSMCDNLGNKKTKPLDYPIFRTNTHIEKQKFFFGDPTGNRTPISRMRICRPNH